jgi:flagellar hook-associated protein 2
MASITSLGVGSGIDANSIIDKLVSIEHQPIDDLQTAKTALDSQVSSFGKVQSYMSALRDAARKLTDASTWSAVSASSSDTASIGVTAGDGAAAGSYSISVDRLAMAQSVTSAPFADSATTVGQGTMTITLGSWSDDLGSFTPKSGATPMDISIDAGDTLADIRDKINGSGAGVIASIVTDSSGARLSIRSKDTGVENGFQLTVNDADGVDEDASGLSQLAYDPLSGANSMTRNQAGQNALATINGISINSASNTLSNVLDGLTVTLNKTVASTSPVSISVAQDNDSMRKAITDFASAYNDAMKYLRDQTAYDPTTKKGGPLQGDRTAISLVSQLRTIAGGSTSASSVFTRLTDIGLEPQKDGTLSIKADKITSALGKLSDLKAMFGTIDASGAAGTTNGIAQQFRMYGDGLLGTDGVFDSRTASLNARIKSNQDQQAAMETRVAAYKARITAQYQALDTQMGSLNGLSSYVSQQMKLLGG